ncbi:MAG: TldD/PmbA family protein [Chloroflexi bacterium]|nr:TldD/PmbA family protein [Chloroflexota bacterium]
MPNNMQEFANDIAPWLKKVQADYAEVRLEEGKSGRISYRGKLLEVASRTADSGGCVRALYKGGWGFVSFNSLDELRNKLNEAVSLAHMAQKGQKSILADVNVHHQDIKPNTSVTPFDTPLAAKKEVLDQYNEIIWEHKDLQTSMLGYYESWKKKVFLNSQGSLIAQERADATLSMSAIAEKNGQVQQSSLSEGALGDPSKLFKLHGQIESHTQNAIDLLKAPAVVGGRYTVLLNPVIAGVFVHEAFGHLSEADFLYENPQMQETMKLGTVFGKKYLTIIDDPTVPNLRGSYAFDDEGTPAHKNMLITEGVLTGRLHSRETAAKMSECPTGSARAINYRHQPIVRMSNTYIAANPQGPSTEEMIANIKEGIYVKNWYGGQTSMEMFTFSAGQAFMIRKGRIEEMLKPIMLSGNVFETLHNISAIGSDLSYCEGGGCGKGGQYPLPVADGSPHIVINNCLVAGA